jgi:DNA-directed RNA polymerase subunit M/transcription elongation factor TFIIS
MAIQNLKTCPRCDGRLLIKREANGWYEECTKCGEKTDISELVTTNTLGQIKISNRIIIEQKPTVDEKLAQGD